MVWRGVDGRRLAQDLTYPLITNLQVECTRETCPEMKAGEWLYLCVAHGNNVGGHVQVGVVPLHAYLGVFVVLIVMEIWIVLCY